MGKLFIIGNGFDLCHGYKTKYTDFKKYLEQNGSGYPIGSSFQIYDLFSDVDEGTWGDLENELPNIDFSSWASWFSSDLNLDLEDKEFDWEVARNKSLLEDFREIKEKLSNALSCALNDFILEATENKNHKKCKFKKLFGMVDKFITFNYSYILEDIYSINPNNILHIHGVAKYRSVNQDDYFFGTLYDDAPIIFGHGSNIVPEDDEVENDFFSPYRILNSISNNLRKSYRIERFGNFVSNCNPLEVEIIGHGFCKVDFPYFKKLNELLNPSSKIIYWLYDDTELNDKRKVLNKIFGNRTIVIKDYKGNILI